MKQQIGLRVLLWALTPLVSAIAFFLIFCYFANNSNLDDFDWRAVTTNVVNSALSGKTNASISAIDSSITNGLVANLQRLKDYKTLAHILSPESHGSSTNAATSSDRLIKELAVRMIWAVSGLGFVFLCIVVVFCSMGIARETLQLSKRGLLICGLGALGIFVLLLFHQISGGPVTTIAGGAAADQLFQIMENDTSTTNASSLNELMREEHTPVLTKIGPMVTWISTGAKVGLVFVGIAGCCILMVMRQEQDEFSKKNPPPDEDISLAKARYEQRVHTTVGLLQITACCLVSAVVEVFLLYTMASYYVVPLLQTHVQYFAQSLATTCGLVYSGLLIAIFLPLIVGQKTIGRELLDSHGGNKVTGQATMFLAQIDDVNPKKAPMVNALVTVFAPVLVAFLTKLASVLSSYF